MTAATVLELIKGSTKPFDVFLFDENEVKEDLSSADRAIIQVRKSIGGDIVLSRDTTANNLTIDSANGKLVATLTGAEAAALSTGTFIASAKVRFGDDDSWQDTDPFQVIIRASPTDVPVVFGGDYGIESGEAFGTPTVVQS